MDDGIERPETHDVPDVAVADDTAETLGRALNKVLQTTAVANRKREATVTLERELQLAEEKEGTAMQEALRIVNQRGIRGTYIVGKRVVVVKPNEIMVTDATLLDVADAERDACGICEGTGYAVKTPHMDHSEIMQHVWLSAKRTTPDAQPCPSCKPELRGTKA